MTRWTQIPTDLGHALWSAIQPRLGVDVGVYTTATDVDAGYFLTIVGVKDGPETPILKCQSWTKHGDHRFFVPAAAIEGEP